MSGRGPQVTVGLDIGTTSVKAVAAGDDGRVAARARVPHAVAVPFADAFEHDVDAAWRSGVIEALGQVAQGLDVAAVNVAAMVPSLAAVGPDGRAVGPGLLYGDARGVDGRGEGDAAMPGDSGELFGFLRWLASSYPGAAGYWPAQAVANHALCGRAAIDTTTAMTAHPLFDYVGWDAGLASAAGVDVTALPDLVVGTEPAGSVLDDLPGAGAVVGGGTIDALGEQLVAGADAVGDVLVICGTTLITWAVVDTWVEAPGVWTIPHTTPGLVLVGGPSNAGGLFLDHVRRWIGEPTADGTAGADAVRPDDVPVWLPYIRGERTPLHRRDLRASLHGLGLAHGPAQVLRAAYEAAGFVVRHHIDLVPGFTPRRLVVTGGGSRVDAWVQALADATGVPAEVVAVPEGAALGSAFVARCVAGLESSMTAASRWARVGRTVEPDPAWVDACAARYPRFRSLSARAP